MDHRVTNGIRRKQLERYEVLFGLRFLTCSCERRLPLFDEEWVRDEFVRALARTRRKHGFALLAWVVMPEHVHLLLIPRLPESPVDVVLNMLKGTMSRRVLVEWRRSGAPILQEIVDGDGTPRFWQAGGGHDRNARGERPLEDLIRYIHENPVQRGLVRSATEWAWSSARWYAGTTDGALPMDDAAAFRESEALRLDIAFGSLGEAARVMKERFGVV